MGALTVAVVTRPFGFEGKRRMQQAERGMQELLEAVDTMIVIPNEKLLVVAKDAGFFESFRVADDVLRQGVQGISDIITIPGIINRDFADVKTTMHGMGYAVMGTAMRSGANRAIEAAQAAMASPLLEAGAIDGARGILINISGSSNLKLSEVNEASTLIQNAAHEEANIIFGAVLDESMGDEVKITVIATGFRKDLPNREELSRDAHSLKPEAPAFLNLDVRPAVPRFASEVVAEAARVSMPVPEPVGVGAAPAVYASGFGSQSFASAEPFARPESFARVESPTFEPIAVHGPAAKERKEAAASPEDSAIGGFLETLTADDKRAREQRRMEESHLEELDVPAFMRKGAR
jgi:cell division protein FtsZ